MNKQLKSILIILVVVAAIFGFFKFATFFGTGERAQSEKPLVICNPPNVPPEQQKCNWTAHSHFMLKVFKGSEEIPLKFETGELQAQHTHVEPNKIHWHGLIPVDSKTKEVTDWSVLEVGKIPVDLKLNIEGTPKFIGNGQEVEPSYVWKDGDTIEIHYE